MRKLPGATLTGFICDGVIEAWVEFSCDGYAFSVNDQFGSYWFFVMPADCPDELLRTVFAHFEQLLGNSLGACPSRRPQP